MRTGDNAAYFQRHHLRAEALEAQLRETAYPCWRAPPTPARRARIRASGLCRADRHHRPYSKDFCAGCKPPAGDPYRRPAAVPVRQRRHPAAAPGCGTMPTATAWSRRCARAAGPEGDRPPPAAGRDRHDRQPVDHRRLKWTRPLPVSTWPTCAASALSAPRSGGRRTAPRGWLRGPWSARPRPRAMRWRWPKWPYHAGRQHAAADAVIAIRWRSSTWTLCVYPRTNHAIQVYLRPR